jgi:hypothetical protein
MNALSFFENFLHDIGIQRMHILNSGELTIVGIVHAGNSPQEPPYDPDNVIEVNEEIAADFPEKTCSVCFDDMDGQSKCAILANCNHAFHL